MKKILLFIAIGVLVFVGMFANSPDTQAVPMPTPTMTPVYEYWQPGESGYFLCEGGWQEEFYGQSFWQKCNPANKRSPLVTPEPGHYLWQAGQNGYYLCENEWYSENYGQSVYRLCPEGEMNEK